MSGVSFCGIVGWSGRAMEERCLWDCACALYGVVRVWVGFYYDCWGVWRK